MELSTLLIFALLLIFGISCDLYAHRNSEEISFKDATLWTIIWILISVVFSGIIAINDGTDKAYLFVTGYLLEKALSVDNLFVFMAIFTWFNIPTNLAHRVLYWGILGAIFFRLIFVLLGTTLMGFSYWVEILFGAIVIWTGYTMYKNSNNDSNEEDFSQNIAYKFAKRFIPITPELNGNKFFVKNTSNIGYVATPLFLCLLVVEVSDILFAFDSVPAIIAVTKEPTIVWTAMILAMCGLRTMYFMLNSLKSIFTYLEKGVILILFFVGGKLIINSLDEMFHTGYNISNDMSLAVVASTLLISIMLSVIVKGKV